MTNDADVLLGVGVADMVAHGRVLTLDEAAERLNTSYSTVYRMVTSGELAGFRMCKAWRTSTGAVDAYLRREFAEQAAGGSRAALR